MKRLLLFGIFCVVLLFSIVRVQGLFGPDARSAVENYCVVGQDDLVFPRGFLFPSREIQDRVLNEWPATSRGTDSDLPSKEALKEKFPFRDGVKFARVSHGIGGAAVYVRDDRSCAVATWDSIGYFMKRVDTTEQCSVVLDVIQKSESGVRISLTARQLAAVLSAAKSDRRPTSLKIVLANFDPALMQQGWRGQDHDRYWVFDDAQVEGSSVVEYKYAIDRACMAVARLRRVVIQGPSFSRPDNEVLEVDKGPKWRAMESKYNEARSFLLDAVRKGT